MTFPGGERLPEDAGSADLGRLRKLEFPELTPPGAFFNAASYGILPRRTMEAVERWTRARGRRDGVVEEDIGPELHRARKAAAKLVGADPSEIALSPNTSYGVNLAAACVAAGEPGTVLLSEGEFLANVVPWLEMATTAGGGGDRSASGFRVERVATTEGGLTDEPRLLERLGDGDVRALALSAVQFQSGYLADLDALGRRCREEGVLFFVDAIQALGCHPVDVGSSGVDILACGAQKWLCSPWGSGFTYVSAGLQDRFAPPMVSWLGYEGSRDFNSLAGDPGAFLPDSRKFELATLGIQAYAGMARSIELFLEAGVGRIREHVLRVQEPLVDFCREGDDVQPVTPLDRARRAGIFAFRTPEQDAVAEALKEAGFVLAVREGMIRFAPHLYNTVAEMDEAVEVMRGVVG